jgi:uncharacterized protein DUF4129
MSPARAGSSAVVAVLGATGLLLVLVTWAASIGPDRVVSGGDAERVEQHQWWFDGVFGRGQGPKGRPLEDRSAEPPDWLGAIAWVLEILTVIVAAYLVFRLLRRLRRAWVARRLRRRPPSPEDVEFEVLGSAGHVSEVIEADAAEQRAALTETGEPRNAIVECWHRFELQGVRAGIARRPWQTTAEFVLEVLDLVGADRGAVARLADLYREARFSDHTMTDAHRAAALAALDDIHASLRVRIPS